MFSLFFFALTFLLLPVLSQLIGTQKQEVRPKLSMKFCETNGQCKPTGIEVVMDQNWRWLHDQSSTNCYRGNEWTKACSSSLDCAQKCYLEGGSYESDYGVSTSGDALTIKFIQRNANGDNIGARLYALNPLTKRYLDFTLLNHEISVTIDLSMVGCALVAAFYFVAMDLDGGAKKWHTKPGAEYGMGYCDAQCARDLKLLGGSSNYDGWVPSQDDPNTGVGRAGSCCAEVDVIEANGLATAMTLHPCTPVTQTICRENTCGGTYSPPRNRFNGPCDADGCDRNNYRLGDKNYFGPGPTFQINTQKKFTAITRFEDSKMTRYYLQDGRLIGGPTTKFGNKDEINRLYCPNVKKAFQEKDWFEEKGGFTAINKVYRIPLVLAFSFWDDKYAQGLWLDSFYPPGSSRPGSLRGPCDAKDVNPRSSQRNALVTYSDIRFGPIGSTYRINNQPLSLTTSSLEREVHGIPSNRRPVSLHSRARH